MEKGNGNTPVKQYNCRLELPNHHSIVELWGDDLGVVKEQVQRLMGGGCHFQPFGNTTLITHPAIAAGQKSFGWISPAIEVPAYLGTRTVIESRRFDQPQAA